MKNVETDKIIEEVRASEAVKDGSFYSYAFEEVPPLSLEAEFFDKEKFEENLLKNVDNRIIGHVYKQEKNPIKRAYKAIVRKLTAILYLNALEEQERHNERTELLIRMLWGKVESLSRENDILKKKLERLEGEK